MPCSKSARSSSEGSASGVTVPLTVTGDSSCMAVPSLFHVVGEVSFVPSLLFEETNGYAHMSPEYLLTSRSVHHWFVGTGFPACDGSTYRCWSTVFCTSALSLIVAGGVGANDPEPTRVPSAGGAGTAAGLGSAVLASRAAGVDCAVSDAPAARSAACAAVAGPVSAMTAATTRTADVAMERGEELLLRGRSAWRRGTERPY